MVMGSRVLVDGGIVNFDPRQLPCGHGVDVVIGVDVTPELIPSERDIGKPPSIVFTLINAFDIMARVVSEPG